MKKLFYAANTIAAIAAGVYCFLWGMNLSSPSVLWYNGSVEGYIFLSLYSIVITGFCMIPSLIVSEW